MPAGRLALCPVFGLKISRPPRPAVRESIVPKFASVVRWVVIVSLSGTAAATQAQNIDAGKSPAQIFSDTCSACHRSPREIKQTTPGFMREHYTTSGRDAAAMAAYLASVGSDPRAVKQRRPPALRAAQEPTETTLPESPPQETDQAPIRPPQPIPQDAQRAAPPELQGAPTSPSRELAPTARPSERAKSSQGAVSVSAIKPRRPSESVEMSRVPVDTHAGALRENSLIEGFEE
jgi:hypothetical protein